MGVCPHEVVVLREVGIVQREFLIADCIFVEPLLAIRDVRINSANELPVEPLCLVCAERALPLREHVDVAQQPLLPRGIGLLRQSLFLCRRHSGELRRQLLGLRLRHAGGLLPDVHAEAVVDARGHRAIHPHRIVYLFVLDLAAVRRRRQRALCALARPHGILGRTLIRLCIARHSREVRMADALDVRTARDVDGIGLLHLVVELRRSAQGNCRPIRRIRQEGELERAKIALARLRVDAASRIEIYIVGTEERACPIDTDDIPARDVRCERRTCRARKTSLCISVHLIAELRIILRRKGDVRARLCRCETAVYGLDSVVVGHAELAVHHGERNDARRLDDAACLRCALCEAVRRDSCTPRRPCRAVLKGDLCRLRHHRGDIARMRRARTVAARRVLVRVAERILRLVVLRTDRLDLRVLYGDSRILSERLRQTRTAAADDCRLKRIDIMQ